MSQNHSPCHQRAVSITQNTMKFHVPTKAPYDADNQDCHSYIFKSKEEMHKNLSRLCYGNLYTLGSLWIEGLSKIMVGKVPCFYPKAAKVVDTTMTKKAVYYEPEKYYKPEIIPKKPPIMPFEKLPLYDTPHKDYKDYVTSKEKCPQYEQKYLHHTLYPYVRRTRAEAKQKLCELKDSLLCKCGCLKNDIENNVSNVKEYMTDGENNLKRRMCFALSTATGALLGYRKGLYRAFVYGNIGALASGWFCYPDETEVALRCVCWETWKLLITGYNLIAVEKYCMEENGPCSEQFQDCRALDEK